jgi:hypothetical protein
MQNEQVESQLNNLPEQQDLAQADVRELSLDELCQVYGGHMATRSAAR